MNIYKKSASILVCLVAASSVMAGPANRYWDNNGGTGDGLWLTTSNWDTMVDGDDLANISAAVNGDCTLSGGAEAFIGGLYLRDGVLDIAAGTTLRSQDADGRFDRIAYASTGTATLNLAGTWRDFVASAGIRMGRTAGQHGIINMTDSAHLRNYTLDVSYAGTGKVNIGDDASMLLTKSTSALSLDADGTMQIEGNGLLEIVGNQKAQLDGYITSGYLYTTDPGGLDVSYGTGGVNRTFVTVIPEPATLGLVAMAGFGALFVRRFMQI